MSVVILFNFFGFPQALSTDISVETSFNFLVYPPPNKVKRFIWYSDITDLGDDGEPVGFGTSGITLSPALF